MSLKIRLARGGAKKRPYLQHRHRRCAQPARRALYRTGRDLQPDGRSLASRPGHPQIENGSSIGSGSARCRPTGWRGSSGEAGLIEKPAMRETPTKSAPKAKAQERAEGRRPRPPRRAGSGACWRRPSLPHCGSASSPAGEPVRASRRAPPAPHLTLSPIGERASAAAAKQVCVGVVTGPHGVGGAVRIKSFTADPKTSPPMGRSPTRAAVGAWSCA